MRIILVCVTGFFLDQLCGDPVWLYHPVRLIGHLISGLEDRLRKTAGDIKGRLLAAGLVMWVLVAGVTTAGAWLLLDLAGRVHPAAAMILEVFWCYQLLAAKSLKQESMKVYDELAKGDLPGARNAVAMIVGRDTAALSEEGVIKAAVETVAENTSDGVAAPLIYMLTGGAPLAFFYKAVNTMDSMVGYKNDKYLYFGRAAARLDDIFNYIPARISACLMTVAAFLTGMDWRGAWRIYRRDRRCHASPNSAQTEAVCAGALGIRLAGNAFYFGRLYEKPTIGDDLRPADREDIRQACRLMNVTAVLALILGVSVRLLVICLCS